ncbi:MAG TPA: 2-iminoacetate synthase ThiH [bacterium]|nr:2-iminoacetate synthase ThiH [bacterium]
MFKPDDKEISEILESSKKVTKSDILKAIYSETLSLNDLAALLSPEIDNELLKKLAARAMELSRKRFGRAISLYIPLYYDNRCTNSCIYCGFNAKNQIERKKLSFDEIMKEAEFIRSRNFKNILLVAGEHPESADVETLVPVIKKLHEIGFTCVSIEIAPLEEDAYRTLVTDAHLDGLYVYQETYNKDIYSTVHPAGRKRDYDWRLETPERGANAGISKIGIGFLTGLNDLSEDAMMLASHLIYLQKYHWQSEYSISFPRIRNAQGVNSEFKNISDRQFIQLVCALRLMFPETGMSLSTREYPGFRDQIIPLGFTNLSAGSSTAPGGYCSESKDLEQFEVEDSRTPEEIAEILKQRGFEPVWKDWQ